MSSGWLKPAVLVLCIFNQRVVESLSIVEENELANTEVVIRSATNELFATFNLTSVHDQPKIKQYSSIHKYLMSLTLQDSKSLNEIAKLSRVDKSDIGIVIYSFIAIINEILDEYNVINVKNVMNGDVDGIYNINDELSKIEYMKNLYMDPNTVLDINTQILQVLKDEDSVEYVNAVPSQIPLIHLDNDTVFNNDSYWTPDEVPVQSRRIYNGYLTKIVHYPFMASVEFFGKFQCSSSLIKTDLAITAASCLQLAWNNRFYRENPSFLSIRVGSTYFESGGESIPILEIYFYPTYNPRNLRNNLAIMRTVRHVVWQKKVRRLPIDTVARTLPLTVNGIIIVGWGARTASNVLKMAFKNKIQYSILSIYPLDDCRDIYGQDYVTKKHFCAGFLSKGTGACNKDVGGPGIVDGYLAGVISFASGACGVPDSPTVFTKVGFYTKWIENIMDQDVPITRKRTTMKPRKANYKTRNKTTEWYVSPINSGERSTMGIPLLDKEEDDNNNKPKISRTQEKEMFKQFLKTMFTSEEIREYRETIKANLTHANISLTPLTGNLSNLAQTTTESNVIEKPFTRLVDFDIPKRNNSNEEDTSYASEEIIGDSTIIAEIEALIPSDNEATDGKTTLLERPATVTVTTLNFVDTNPKLAQNLKLLAANDNFSSYNAIFELGTAHLNEKSPERIENVSEIATKTIQLPEDASLNDLKIKDRIYKFVQTPSPLYNEGQGNQLVQKRIDEAVISLLQTTNQQKIGPILNQQPDFIDNDNYSKKSNKLDVNKKEKQQDPALSSNYENDSVEFHIPIRSTAILESFDNIPTPTTFIEQPAIIVPKGIFPKMHREQSINLGYPKVFKMSEANISNILLNNKIVKVNNSPSLQNMSIAPFKTVIENMPIMKNNISVLIKQNNIIPPISYKEIYKGSLFLQSEEERETEKIIESTALTTRLQTPANQIIGFPQPHLPNRVGLQNENGLRSVEAQNLQMTKAQSHFQKFLAKHESIITKMQNENSHGLILPYETKLSALPPIGGAHTVVTLNTDTDEYSDNYELLLEKPKRSYNKKSFLNL